MMHFFFSLSLFLNNTKYKIMHSANVWFELAFFSYWNSKCIYLEVLTFRVISALWKAMNETFEARTNEMVVFFLVRFAFSTFKTFYIRTFSLLFFYTSILNVSNTGGFLDISRKKKSQLSRHLTTRNLINYLTPATQQG
jgi:hypothetical protein